MESGGAGQLRKAAVAGQREEFVGLDGVSSDHRKVVFLSQFISDEAAGAGDVKAVLFGSNVFQHIFGDAVDSALNGFTAAASGHDAAEILQIILAVFQELQDGFFSKILLVQGAGVLAQLILGVVKGFSGHFLIIFIYGNLGGCGTKVHDQ